MSTHGIYTVLGSKHFPALNLLLFFHLWELAQGTGKGHFRSCYPVVRMRHGHSVQYTQPWEGAAGEQVMGDAGEKGDS